MKIVSNLRQLIKMGDFFNSNQMLRFQKETEYRTFTGGLISIGIIITITIAFANMIISTVNRTIISFTHNQQRDTVPGLSEIITSPDKNFMFAVEVQGYNLSSEYRYFDVVFDQIQSSYGHDYVNTPYTLQMCTKAHWAMLPSLVEDFEKVKASNWLCPTIGTVIRLQGKFSSQTYNQMSVTLYPCSNTTDPSRPCAPREQIDAHVLSNGQWNYFNFYFLNSIINADQPQYKSYYLEDRNYIPFSSTLGNELDMYLIERKITSDNSIWPFKDEAEDSVFYIPFGPILYPIAVSDQTCYATFYIMKDYANEFYIRQVQKIFVVFSFMGGLIGAIMASLFIINTYTSFAFELALALQVFRVNKNGQSQKKLLHNDSFSLNILHFFKYIVYSVVKKLKPSIKSPFYEHIAQCRDEILEQLDIRNLIKRLIFLEYSISFILEDYQLAEMHAEKPTLPYEIKRLRRKIQSEQQTTQDQIENEDTNKQLYPQISKIQKSQCSSISQKKKLRRFQTPSVNQAVSKINPTIEDAIKVTQQLPNASNILVYDQSVSNIRKKHQNLKKLKDSAKQGNIVSRKLLQIINYPKQNSPSQVSSRSKRQL